MKNTAFDNIFIKKFKFKLCNHVELYFLLFYLYNLYKSNIINMYNS